MAYLLRRRGRFHFQMRLGAALESCVGISHVRCALRTGDRREAGRRLMTALEYGHLFKDAPDLDEFGAALARKLEPLVAAGPPTSAEALKDRRIVEDMIGAFFQRSRERDFAFVRVPGLIALFRAFIEQNIAAEHAAERRAWTVKPAPTSAQTPWRARMLAEIFPLEAQPRLETVGNPQTARLAEVHRLTENDDRQGAPHGFVERTQDQLPPTSNHNEVLALLSGISARLDQLEPTLREPETPGIVEDIRLSDAVDRFLKAEEKRRGSSKSDALVGPVTRFLVEFLNDKRLCEITADDLARLDQALTEIPGIKGFSLEMRSSLHDRYLQAQKDGWDKLNRASETTVELRYRRPLRIVFAWLKQQKLYAGPDLEFTAAKTELLAVLPRDKFNDDEILRLVSCPLFTGCASRKHIWQPGCFFYQGHHYWAFLLLMFSGMRAGEPPQIDLDDFLSFTEVDETGKAETFHFIDMRPYDPAQGRKSIKDLKHLKRGDFARVIPVHRMLVELGLLERVERLRAIGETRLFPGWEAHKSAAEEVRWGKVLSRTFDYGRQLKHVNIVRTNVSLYSLRHLLADLLDDTGTPQRLRHRVLGHRDQKAADNAADEYGGKGLPSALQARHIVNLDTPLIRKVAEILLEAKTRAENGGLTILNPF